MSKSEKFRTVIEWIAFGVCLASAAAAAKDALLASVLFGAAAIMSLPTTTFRYLWSVVFRADTFGKGTRAGTVRMRIFKPIIVAVIILAALIIFGSTQEGAGDAKAAETVSSLAAACIMRL